MDKDRVIGQLEAEFSGRDIFVGTGIIGCEVEREGDSSRVVAFIDYERPHYHTRTSHVYRVEAGELSLHEAGKIHILQEGEEHVIPPGKVHSANGESTRVIITSSPGQSSEDSTRFPRM